MSISCQEDLTLCPWNNTMIEPLTGCHISVLQVLEVNQEAVLANYNDHMSSSQVMCDVIRSASDLI